MPDDETGPFAGTESHYAAHRPGYDERAIEYLAERFSLADGRVLDVGCGAGQLAIPLAARAAGVLGIDPNEAMVRAARRRAEAAGVENAAWRVGSDADLPNFDGSFRLVTMGRSFHWMDEERTLESVWRLTDSMGGIALVDDREWLTHGTEPWQDVVYRLAGEYVDLPERTGPVEYDDPWDELLEAAGFRDVETRAYDSEREWDLDAIVGYVLSLSYCSPDAFGGRADAFEADLRSRLAGEGPFTQAAVTTVIAGTSPTETDFRAGP